MPVDIPVNFILTATDALGTVCRDTVKYLGYLDNLPWPRSYPEDDLVCNIQSGNSYLFESNIYPSTRTGVFDWLELGIFEFDGKDAHSCCPRVTLESSAIFTAYITDENGCVNKIFFDVIITNVDEHAERESFKVFPNPIGKNEMLHIDFPNNLKTAYFNLYNHTGNMMITQSIHTHSNAISLNNLPTGIYYYQVQHAQQIKQAGKLVVKP